MKNSRGSLPSRYDVILLESWDYFPDGKKDIIRTESDIIRTTRTFKERGKKALQYCDFCQNFYISRSNGGLMGIRSKEKIPEFFMRAVGGDETAAAIPYSGSAYAKWLDGSRKPETNIWECVVKEFDEVGFSRNVAVKLNEKILADTMKKFGIEFSDGEIPDKDMFAIALAKQFYAIACGNGEADNVVSDAYREDVATGVFTDYAKNSFEKYKKMKTLLYSSEERLFDDFFVCNTVTTDRYQFRARKKVSSKVIENVTLEKLLEKSKCSLIVGMGGIGKSMMMRHLFLESIRQYPKTGIMPILVTLREFCAENGDLFGLIMKSVNRFDSTYKSVHLHKMLLEGKCQILLDGLDEVKYNEMETFERQLDALVDRYPNNQYVMSTRRFSTFVELSRFRVVWMLDFSLEQSLQLIDKLDFCPEEPKLKQEFRDRVIKEYSVTHTSFVSNPLLLTLMLMNFRRFSDVPEKKYLFYQQAYETLLYRHDADKLAYRRVFRSVKDPSEFTEVFREFCAKSYRHGDYEFDDSSFESYYNTLHKKDAVDPSLMNKDNFLFDILHSVCLMYEEGQSYHFLHRSFQEYFFADYYFRQDDTTLQKLGRALSKNDQNMFDDANGFEMLHELDPQKVDRFILLPYLESIFEGKDKSSAYRDFLEKGFGEISFYCVDKKLMKEYANNEFAIPQGVNEAENVVMNFVLSQCNPEPVFSFSITDDPAPYKTGMAWMFFARKIPAGEKKDKEDIIRFMRMPYEFFSKEPSILEMLKDDSFVIDKNGKPICFGTEYCIPVTELFDNKEKYARVNEALNNESMNALQLFNATKLYYESLKEQYADANETEDDDF